MRFRVAKGRWAPGWRSSLFEGQRPKGPSFEEPFGTKVGFPSKRGTGDVLGSTLVSVSLLRCGSFGLDRLPQTLSTDASAPLTVLGPAKDLLIPL